MSDTNGTNTPPRSLRELREQRRLVQAEIELRRLERSQRLLESVGDYWDDWKRDGHLIDRVRQLGDGLRTLAPPASPQDRRHGQNWPVWRTEQELNRFRQQSRILCTVNSYAKGLLRNLTNYTVRNGYGYKVISKESSPDADPRRGGRQQSSALTALVDRVQDWLDGWQKRNRWGQRQREIFRRVLRDGEAFVRLFGDRVRFIEPEQVVNPVAPEGGLHSGWSFGIQHEIDEDGHEDVETRLAYHVVYGEDVTQGEEVPAEEVVHVLPADHDSTVKRGLPAFIYDTADALIRASKLQRNISIGNAIQAATAEYWQYANGATAGAIQSLVTGLKEETVTDLRTGRDVNIERIEPGTIRRGPGGVEILNLPKGVGTSEMLAGAQGDLRQASSAFSAPEYLTGDASNANYASTKEASAPFTVAADTDQDHYREAFLEVIRRCLVFAVEEGELPPEALTLVEVQAEPPAVVTTDELERSQSDEIAVVNGWKSRKTCALERNLDWEAEEIANEEWEQRHPQQPALQPGAGLGGPDPRAAFFPQPQQEGLGLARRRYRRLQRQYGERIAEGIAGAARQLLAECGGEGSGKPGPCPKGGPKKKGAGGKAAPKAAPQPLDGHPMSGKSKEEQYKHILSHTGANAVAVLPYPAPSPDHEALGADVLGAIAAQKQKNAFQRLTIPQLYQQMREKRPGLTLHQFQGDLAALHKAGKISLGPYTQALATLPDTDLPFIMPFERDPKFYVSGA